MIDELLATGGLAVLVVAKHAAVVSRCRDVTEQTSAAEGWG